MPGEGGFCYRADRADEVSTEQPLSDMDATELRFLEQIDRVDADVEDGR
jgi:hypothetical protein